MYLNARLNPHSELSRQALLDTIAPDLGDPVNGRHAVRVGTGALHRALTAGDDADGFGVSCELVLSKQEMNAFTWFEPVCRKVAQETDADHDKNFAACEATPWQPAGAEEPIRLVRGFSLTRIGIQPNHIAGIGEWTGEYLIGTASQAALKAEALSGWSAATIGHTKTGAPHEAASQLYCEHVLPPAVRDCSIETIQSPHEQENGKLRRLGCLAYPARALDARPDFNRTAEPWQGWHGWPAWVVSARVKNAFDTHGLKGWRFRPVFETETDLYRQYLAAWAELSECVRATRLSRFDGGQW